MKLQSASRKEICRIGLGTLVCDGILIAGLFLLDQFHQLAAPIGGAMDIGSNYKFHFKLSR